MQKKKMGAVVSVTSDFSSSESESEEVEPKFSSSEASDSSDSDGLETWMILGRANQDGDQSISLNLKGVCVSSSGETPICFQRFVFWICLLFVLAELVSIYLQHIDKEAGVIACTVVLRVHTHRPRSVCMFPEFVCSLPPMHL